MAQSRARLTQAPPLDEILISNIRHCQVTACITVPSPGGGRASLRGAKHSRAPDLLQMEDATVKCI